MREMTRLWIVAVMVAAGMVFFAGCGQGAGEASSDYSEPPRHATTCPTPPDSDRPGFSGSGKRPPNSHLSHGGKTVTGTLGSYCWIGLCTRTPTLVPDEREALAAPSGAALVFEYGGEEPPSRVWAGQSPLVGAKVGGPGDPTPERLSVRREGGRTEIPAALPAGEYLIDVFVRIPEGDATYYFRVVVEPDAGTLPDSGGPGGR